MLRRLRRHFPEFPVKSRELRDPSSETGIAQQHEPRNRVYRLKPFALRSIANYPVPVSRNQLCVSIDRRATPTGEMVHISALERLGKPVPTSGKERPYEPQNLLAVLRHIQATYSAKAVHIWTLSRKLAFVGVFQLGRHISRFRTGQIGSVFSCSLADHAPSSKDQLRRIPGRRSPCHLC